MELQVLAFPGNVVRLREHLAWLWKLCGKPGSQKGLEFSGIPPNKRCSKACFK